LKTEHVKGKDGHTIMLYALSTCGWCRKTKELLTELGVAFDYAYVDLVPKEERNAALAEVGKYNRTGNFPTTVIDDKKVIVGFNEKELREALA
jgi:glutaredoxin-like protein NrdH